MKRLIPVQLLHLLENWLLNCYSCVKWADSFSQFFKLEFGVMQGSVMSPLLFAVYVDDLAKSCDCSSPSLIDEWRKRLKAFAGP